jgi:hypothetical protein
MRAPAPSVRPPEGRETPLLHLDGAGLEAVLKRPGLPDLKEKKKLGAGLRAVAFL